MNALKLQREKSWLLCGSESLPASVHYLQAVMSKWFGESEGLLAKVFKAAEALGGAIIFIVSVHILQKTGSSCSSCMLFMQGRKVAVRKVAACVCSI